MSKPQKEFSTFLKGFKALPFHRPTRTHTHTHTSTFSHAYTHTHTHTNTTTHSPFLRPTHTHTHTHTTHICTHTHTHTRHKYTSSFTTLLSSSLSHTEPHRFSALYDGTTQATRRTVR